jgi:hypothetical protein
MRKVIGAILALLLLPVAAAAAPSTAPDYTATDQVQFAKLEASNGTWTCKDTPASVTPDVFIGKQSGNWFVWSESGDQPSTTYVRWVHTLKAYVQNEIDAEGTTEIYTTRSLDPFNAIWKPAFPLHAGLYPFTYTFHDGALGATGKYRDRKTHKVFTFKAVCTKG